MSFHMIVVITM